MKKVLMLIIVTMSFIALFTIKVDAYYKTDFINLKGVNISEAMYDKMHLIGYTNKEIMNVSIDEYNELANINIVKVQTNDYYIKTTTIKNKDGHIFESDEEISKEQAYKEISENKESERESKSNSSPNRVSPDKDFDFIDDGGSGAPTESSNTTVDYKHLKITGSYYKEQGNLGTFFVKVNLEWLRPPKERLNDIISINIADNLQIKSEYINGSQYPKFNSKLMYDEKYSMMYSSPISEDEYIEELISHEVVYNGDDINNYTYKIDQGIGVSFQLPSDVETNLSQNNSVLIYNYNYTNFYITLSAEFIPKQQGINATTFAGTYQHQTGKGKIDWGNVTFSTTPPYFSYSTSFWVNDPTFETIGNQIFFEDLL